LICVKRLIDCAKSIADAIGEIDYAEMLGDSEMAKRILVINGHPDHRHHHLCTAFAEAYIEGASGAGHEIRRIDLAGFQFPMLQSQSEFENGDLPEELDVAVENILWAEHLVFVFPLWLGTMPALVKAFLEQVMRPGIAFEYGAGGMSTKALLKGRTARLIVTMGMPSFVYRLWFMNHGIAALRRGILNFVGIKPVRDSLFGMVGNAGESKCRKWLKQVKQLGSRGA
jgi:putative NADPH-quinone reductase